MALFTDFIVHTDLSPQIEPLSSMKLPFAFVARGILEGCFSVLFLVRRQNFPHPQLSSFGSGQSYLSSPLRVAGQPFVLTPFPQVFLLKVELLHTISWRRSTLSPWCYVLPVLFRYTSA